MEVHPWGCVPLPATPLALLCLCGHRVTDTHNGCVHLCTSPCGCLLPIQQRGAAHCLCGESPSNQAKIMSCQPSMPRGPDLGGLPASITHPLLRTPQISAINNADLQPSTCTRLKYVESTMKADSIVCAAVVCTDSRSGGLCGLAVLQDDGRDELGAECAADYGPLLRAHAGLLLIPEHGGHHLQGGNCLPFQHQATRKPRQSIATFDAQWQRLLHKSCQMYVETPEPMLTGLAPCAVDRSAALWDHMHHPGHLGAHHFPTHGAGWHCWQEL